MAFDSSLGVGIAIGATVGSTVGRAFESVTDKSRRVGDALARTNKRADRHRQELRRLRAEQERTGDESGDLARHIRNVGDVLQRTTRRAAGYRLELRRAQQLEGARRGRDRALRQGAVALGGAYAAGRLFAGSFERERAELRLGSLLAGPTRDVELGRGRAHSREDVRRGRVLQGEGELLQVQADLRGADLTAEVARIGSTLSAKIATVTGGSARDVASVLGDAYTLFGDQFEGDTAARLGSIGELLAATQKKYKFEAFSDLGGGLREVVGQAVTSKLPLDQTAAALGLLSKAGLSAGRGGTALNAVLRQLPGAADKLHTPIVRLDDDSLDLAATLEALAERLNRIQDVDARNQAIQEMFGDEGARGLAPLLEQLGLFRDGVAEITNPIETVDQSHQRWLDAASGKSQILRNNLVSLRDTIATGLVPVFGPLIGAVTGVAVEIGAMAERTPVLAAGMKVAAGAVGAFVGASLLIRGGRWAVLQVADSYRTTRDAAQGATRWVRRVGSAAGRGVASGASAVGRFVGALVRVSRVGRVATAVTWLWNAALLANPIGAVVVAVVAGAALIGGAVYLIYKHWEPIKAFFGNLWGAVTAEFAPVVEAWSAVFTDFSWAGVGKAIVKTLVGGVVGSAKLLWDGVSWVFGKVGDLLPSSDAREGPLSRLTASGGAVLRTIGDGVSRAGPGALRGPLSRQLAAAAVGLTLAATTPSAAAAAPPLAPVVEPVVAPAAPPLAPVVEPVVAPAAPPLAPVVEPVVAPAAPPLAPVVEPVVAPAAPPLAPVVEPVVAPAAPPLAPVVEPVVAPAAPTPLDEVASPPAAPSPAPAAPVVNNDYSRISITIQAAPGEDVRRLADRLMAEIDRRRSLRRWEGV